MPSLLFTGPVRGRADEAIAFWTSTFGGARRGELVRSGDGNVIFADFMLEGQWFAAMDNPQDGDFTFNEAVSFIVRCDDQREIDRYWSALSAAPEAEQCGWLKDRFGLSWQVVPAAMDRMMREGTPEQIACITQAFLPMKKFDLAALQRAYDGR